MSSRGVKMVSSGNTVEISEKSSGSTPCGCGPPSSHATTFNVMLRTSLHDAIKPDGLLGVAHPADGSHKQEPISTQDHSERKCCKQEKRAHPVAEVGLVIQIQHQELILVLGLLQPKRDLLQRGQEGALLQHRNGAERRVAAHGL